MKKEELKIAVLGCGNIGRAIADGLEKTEGISTKNIYLTKRKTDLIKNYKKKGFNVTANNRLAVKNSDILIIAVTPQQFNELIDEIKDLTDTKRHIILSIVSGAHIEQIKNHFGKDVKVVRVMPNTAIAIQESMTCISGDDKKSIGLAVDIFNNMGKTVVIREELMVPATALCACGIAFFMRAVRAASQGGIEIGFHADEALAMAAQTAKGAAALIMQEGNHPEREVDKVTTPRGCTISGLNQMEHHGFSSSLIKGIVTSAEKADTLYSNKG
ncbi:MAG: pyrroline-5-carboxylate reductase [Ignavibacteria bacterium]|jgi:pyrroline-5-carboxylate reductase